MNHLLFFMLYGLSHCSPALDAAVFWVARYGGFLAVACTAAALAVSFRRTGRARSLRAWMLECLVVGITVVSSWLVSVLLKVAFHAPRPFVAFSSVRPLFSESPFTSFPSGHATVLFALAAAVFAYDWRAGWLLGGLAFLVSVARVVAGVHYPVDILAGAVIGTSVAWFLRRYISRSVSSIFLSKNK